MIDFKNRSEELEMMDLPINSKNELMINLNELTFINKMTGGIGPTFNAFKELIKNKKGKIKVLDVGYGAGDFINYLYEKKSQLKVDLEIIGVDLMPEAKEFALNKYPQLKNIDLHVDDFYNWLNHNDSVDIIVCGLFCHHLNDDQLVKFLTIAKSKARIGVIINDLHRSPIAYQGIKIPTRLFSQSKFTKNDAPLSVLRAFKREDWIKYLKTSNITQFRIKWKWAYRWVITILNDE